MTLDTNFHAGYVAPPSFTADIIDLLNFVVETNSNVSLPTTLVEIYGEFASEWTYEWATVKEYVNRLEEWIVCGTETFLAAVCIMRRLEQRGAIPPINQRSVHRVFLTCLVLAVKYMEDETLSNTDFAKVGCVTVQELNSMEQAACVALEFNCTISPEEFATVRAELKNFSTRSGKRKCVRPKTSDPITFEDIFTSVQEAEVRKLRVQSTSFMGSVRKSSQFLLDSSKRRFSTNSSQPSNPTPTNNKAQPIFIFRQDSV